RARRLLLVLDHEARISRQIGRIAATSRSILSPRLSCSAMYLIDSGIQMIAASATTIGTIPPISKRIGQPKCGMSAAAPKPAPVPPTGTPTMAMIASVASSDRGADSALIATTLGMSPPIPRPQPEQLRQVGRVGGGEGEDAEQDTGPDQGRLAAITVADPTEY